MRYVLPTHLIAKIKKFALLIILAVGVIIFAFLALRYNGSPEGAISRDYKYSAYEHGAEVAQAPLQCDKGTYIYIYTTRKGELASAILDKGLLGYQLRSISGFISEDDIGASISTTYSRFFGNYTVTWGIGDSTLAQVTVGDTKAELISADGKVLWFACEKGVIKPGDIIATTQD